MVLIEPENESETKWN